MPKRKLKDNEYDSNKSKTKTTSIKTHEQFLNEIEHCTGSDDSKVLKHFRMHSMCKIDEKTLQNISKFDEIGLSNFY